MNSFFRKLRWLIRRPDKEAELREELQFHLEEEAEQRQGDGLTEDEARWAARRELGNLALVQEDTRAAWGWARLEQLGARRRLWTSPDPPQSDRSRRSQSPRWRSASAGLRRCSARSTRS